jgi:hypothetical protein
MKTLVEKQTKWLPFEEAREFARGLGFKTQNDWFKFKDSVDLPHNIPKSPKNVYKKEWVSFGDWLGNGNIQRQLIKYITYDECSKWAIDNGINSAGRYYNFFKKNNVPFNIPRNPDGVYENKGWVSWGNFLKNGRLSKRNYCDYSSAEKWVQTLNLKNTSEFKKISLDNLLANFIPSTPDRIYKNQGWEGWSKFLGTGRVSINFKLNYNELKEIVKDKKIISREEYLKWYDKQDNFKIPKHPDLAYKNLGWEGWSTFLNQFAKGNHRWFKEDLIYYINSLKNELNNLDSIELITIINSNNLAQRLNRIGKLDVLILSRSGSQDRQNAVNDILETIKNSTDETIDTVEDTQINTVQDVLTQEQIDNIVTIQEQQEELPRPNVVEEMRAYDNNMLTTSLDDENVDFLLKNGLKKIWIEVLSNRFDVESYRTEEGGENFNIIKDWFFSEYDEAMGLPLPKDYHFKDDKGNLLSPNLMQRLISLRNIRDKSYGNWSDTGTGKTLAGLLTGRIYSEMVGHGINTLIVCNNATVEGWKNSINDYFKFNNIYTKTTMEQLNMNDVRVVNGGHNYIIVNYEKFQQKDGEWFVYNLVNDYNIGYVILDEVHNIKQREVDNESIRRGNVVKLITALREKNPELLLSTMSATPIINNFYEPKAIIELLTGEIHNDIETTENIQNGIELYKLLTRHGLRYRGIKFVKENTDIRRINGNHLLTEIENLTAGDLLKTEQILLQDKLENIKGDIKKGTLIYTHYITGLKNTIGDYVENLGFTVGYYTGGDKEGLAKFNKGQVDVLIGSTPVGTGVDGIQKVCDRMIIMNLPWTNADFKQLKGRVIDRTGCVFDKVDIIIPQVYIEGENNTIIWDWDNWRYERVKFKKTLMDLVLDGEIPEGKLPTKQKLLQDALVQLGIWKERIESRDIITTQREELKVPLNPEMVEKLQRKLGDFSEMNRLWSVSNSTTTGERLKDNPEIWYQYHTLYKEKRKEWNEIPYEVIGKKISVRPDWIVGDFGCGENLLSKEITNKVHSFDHIAIDEKVISCDISNVPLDNNVLDVVVFSLSLMGSNYKDYLQEGYRTLRPYGVIMICEPKGAWEENPTELLDILREIGFTADIDRVTDKFIYVIGNKK